MTVPSQRNRCRVYEWCTASGRHKVHTGDAVVVATARGVKLRIALHAEGREAPVVQLETAFTPAGALLEIAELEPAEARHLSEVLDRMSSMAKVSTRPR
jgi:hypothetical protein